jgi:hypothetical protein
MNTSKWAQDLAAPVRPLNELRAKYTQLLCKHEGLLRQLNAVFERQRDLGVVPREEAA